LLLLRTAPFQNRFLLRRKFNELRFACSIGTRVLL
jgi:hypothetical protein